MTTLTLDEKIEIEARKQRSEMLDAEIYLPDYYTAIYAVLGYDDQFEAFVNEVVQASDQGFITRREQLHRLVDWAFNERHTGEYHPSMVEIQVKRYLGIK